MKIWIKEIISKIFSHYGIRKKILGLIYTVFIPLFLVLIMILIFLFAMIQKNFNTKSESESNAVFSRYEVIKERLLTVGQMIAQSPLISDALEIGKANVISENLSAFSNAFKIPFLSIHDHEGFCLGKVSSSTGVFKDESQEEYVKIALQEKRALRTISKSKEGYILITIIPIFSGFEKNKFIGFASAGYFFNHEFAALLKGSSESEIMFIENGKIKGSSISHKEENIKLEEKIQGIKDQNLSLSFNQKVYDVRIIPLLTDKDQQEISIIIAINKTVEQKTSRFSFMIVLLFLILSLIFIYYRARRITKKITDPINTLVDVAKMISEGNYKIKVKINTKDEIELLAKTFNYMMDNLKDIIEHLDLKVAERTMQMSQILEQKKMLISKIEQELAMAALIQRNLIPSVAPEVNGIDFHFFYQPMAEVGGDFYDFIKITEPDSIGIFISDVSGHGVPAAFITSMLKMLIWTSGNNKYSPSRLLKYLNDNIKSQILGNFLTAFYDIYDNINKVLIYARGGHPNPILIRNGELHFLESKGKILGVYDGIEFDEKEIPLQSGDKVIFFTDGLIEATNNNNDQFENKFIQILTDSHQLKIKDLLDKIRDEMLDFSGNKEFEDDICMVGIEVK